MDITFTEKEIDMICKYYGVYNFEEDENILTYQERKILVDRFVKEWDKTNKTILVICNGPQLMITADVLKGRTCSGYYAIEADIKNAGATYDRSPVVIDRNIVSCPHYDFMGDWMREGIKIYNTIA